MRIVTDGKQFAVKKGFWIFSEFRDLRDDCWWENEPYVTKYCWGTLQQAQDAMERAKKQKRKHWNYK